MHGSEDGSACWPDPDTVSGIEGKQGTSEAGVIPTSVSRETLPDFVALLECEFAASMANDDHAGSVAPSSLGAGEILLTARELSGLSQRKLATELDTSQPSIAVLESGRRLPTIRTLIKVVEAAGLELVVGLRRPAARHPVSPPDR
jgi:DNA-binding XRE family transcriptional regulator